MFKKGPIPAFVHGLLEYAVAILLIAAPFLFTFDSDTATGISIAAGVVVLIVNASTAMSTGLVKSIPVQAHVMLDYALAFILIASPFLFSFERRRHRHRLLPRARRGAPADDDRHPLHPRARLR